MTHATLTISIISIAIVFAIAAHIAMRSRK
jgi:hypothetical protein